MGKVKKNQTLIHLNERKPKFDTPKWEILNIEEVFAKVAKLQGISKVFQIKKRGGREKKNGGEGGTISNISKLVTL